MVGMVIPEILGIELASFLDKKSNENFKILILGFELASFLDKKSNKNFKIMILGYELASFLKIFGRV